MSTICNGEAGQAPQCNKEKHPMQDIRARNRSRIAHKVPNILTAICLSTLLSQSKVAALRPNKLFLSHDGNWKRQPLLRVFILAGQSNMVGHGVCDETDADTGMQKNGTLRWLVDNVPSQYGMLKSDDGIWTERTDIWVACKDEDVSPEIKRYGHLRPCHCGGDVNQEGAQVGPELGFGWAVANGLNTVRGDKVLLIKVAWGGKSLAVDFRPPSSGKQVGPFYDAVINIVNKTLSNLESYFPSALGHGRALRISGFGWHQGWNDGCDAQMTAEYEFNLSNLIRDIRKSFDTPNLPVSIGVSGMAGYTPGLRTDIVNAQFAVSNETKYPEFRGNVASVETRTFLREPWPHSPSNFGYHWNNNAESLWLVGKAMGIGMVEMVSKVEEAHANEISTFF